MRPRSAARSNSTGSGRSDGAAHLAWADRGTCLRSALPEARRSSMFGPSSVDSSLRIIRSLACFMLSLLPGASMDTLAYQSNSNRFTSEWSSLRLWAGRSCQSPHIVQDLAIKESGCAPLRDLPVGRASTSQLAEERPPHWNRKQNSCDKQTDTHRLARVAVYPAG